MGKKTAKSDKQAGGFVPFGKKPGGAKAAPPPFRKGGKMQKKGC